MGGEGRERDSGRREGWETYICSCVSSGSVCVYLSMEVLMYILKARYVCIDANIYIHTSCTYIYVFQTNPLHSTPLRVCMYVEKKSSTISTVAHNACIDLSSKAHFEQVCM